MKKLIITTLLVTTAMTSGVLAESNDSVHIPAAPNLSSVYSVTENTENVKVYKGSEKRTKERGDRLVEERIRALTSNSESISENKKLTAEQKALLVGILSTNSTNLTQHKVAFSTTTDASTTKAYIESIYKDFRIFGIVIPKVRLEARIYQLKGHATTLSETFAKLQTKIDEQKAKGNDTSSWQKGLDEAKMLVAQNMFTLDELLKKTATLTPSSYGTTSKAIIESVNKDIKLISKDFNTVVSKVRKPYSMKKLPPVTASSTPSMATSTIR